MKAIVGTIIVLVCFFGGYLPHGSAAILFQPLEMVIIFGCAFGAYVIANPGWVIKAGLTQALGLVKKPAISKALYVDLLGLLFRLFNQARREGLMSLEAHIDDPHSSDIFNRFPSLLNNQHAVDFICDYLRLIITGVSNPYQLEDLMVMELEVNHHEEMMPAEAVNRVAEALPGFGIIAAVLGIIITMSYLDAGPLEIAHHMSVALVGTFLGILASYAFVGPIANDMRGRAEQVSAFFLTIKTCLMANVNGYAPTIAVEFGRKSIPAHYRPSFHELEDYLRTQK
ncbi:flagellar motor stator protein MotA [Thiomicrospira sp. ALE5]|uniref:flagellar motor stator protein MotA n=1 Tax=Thiomicrospira sp. ALE5 TaxID=748650 RepID=UPI0008EB1AFF|nr:flagellar motor stator protein MotA [Thiomicrospira sp. ALE5]SFR59225.1 chemotaxis protein MotA [Thiomicrospira sp. ALE5]